jgi:signal transduction histidine kinase
MNKTPIAVVVNDDLTQLNVLSALLRKVGLEPLAFTGAEAALAAMTARAGLENQLSVAPPALIVTDLYMPGIDGWRFCRLLRSPEYAVLNQVPILVVSATFSGAETSRIAADLGAAAFLHSPVEGKRFCELVRAILNGEKMRTPLRILIVDDNASLCEMLQAVFASHGYEAHTAFTASAAAAAFDKAPYDVALLDYHLPDGTGAGLLEYFHARRPDCVCLMMTGDVEQDIALESMKGGAAAYLQKPFQPAYLIDLCAKAYRERSLLRVEELLDWRTRELRASEAQNRQLQKAESLGLMAAAIAHHFNNHLMGVMMNMEIAMKALPNNSGPAENLRQAMLSARKAAEVSGLMRTYLGETNAKFEPLDLSAVCLQNLPMLRASIPNDGTLDADLPSPGPFIEASANQLQQVLVNLIANACDACPGGPRGIRLTVGTVASADIPTANRFPIDFESQETGYACLQVEDAGCGIAAGDIGKIFEPFFSTKFTGRGLGLAVVLGIVRAHSGVVTVQSAPNQGSVFRIFIPLLETTQ